MRTLPRASRSSCCRPFAIDGLFLLWVLQPWHLIYAQTTTQNGTATSAGTGDLKLVPSSSFRMVLQPTYADLNFSEVKAVEKATTDTMLLNRFDGSKFEDVEVVIQKVEFLQYRGRLEGLPPTSRIRFFALATVLVASSETDQMRQAAVNDWVETSFETASSKAYFLEQLTNSSGNTLATITSVAVAPIAPAAGPTPTPSDNGDGKASGRSNTALSTLDIVLIVVSGAIFLGIAYMIIQHHKDRGFIENQRLHALNASSNASYDSNPGQGDLESPNGGGSSTAIAHNKGKVAGGGYIQQNGLAPHIGNSSANSEAPSTPSTTNSGDMEFFVNPQTPERPIGALVAATTTTTSAHSMGSRQSMYSGSKSIVSSGSKDSSTGSKIIRLPLPGSSKKTMTTQSQASLSPTRVASPKPTPASLAASASMAESFDSRWFKKVAQEPNQGKSGGTQDGDEDLKRDSNGQVKVVTVTSDGSIDSSSSDEMDDDDESSEDLFHVDVDHCYSSSSSSIGSGDPSDEEKSRHSLSSSTAAIAEWMKSIRVVSLAEPNKPSEMQLWTHSVSTTGRARDLGNHISSAASRDEEKQHNREAVVRVFDRDPYDASVSSASSVEPPPALDKVSSHVLVALPLAELEDAMASSSVSSNHSVPSPQTTPVHAGSRTQYNVSNAAKRTNPQAQTKSAVRRPHRIVNI